MNTNWNGEGIPPVGTVCEWHPNVHGWVEVTILGRDANCTWYRVKGEAASQTCRNMAFFRPIRTPEQIASEERRVEIKHMQAASCGNAMPPICESAAAALYDAGYRKQ